METKCTRREKITRIVDGKEQTFVRIHIKLNKPLPSKPVSIREGTFIVRTEIKPLV